MKIGIMLRHYRQHEGGVKVYTHNLLARLIALGAHHQYLLMYQDRGLVGSYAGFPNVEEVALQIPGTVAWDQIAVPWIAWRHRVDLIFNPKFTVPLLGSVPSVFALHGSEWFALPEYHKALDRLYVRLAFPLYCNKAARVIAVSESVKEDVLARTHLPPHKLVPIHNGFDPEVFHVIDDRERLEAVRRKHALPERFILWAGQIDGRKNVSGLLEAFARIRQVVPHSLVLAGQNAWNGPAELRAIDAHGLHGRVFLTGWLAQADLAALYNLADLFVFPSFNEGFGIPLLEAMACACPIITATKGAPPEVVAGAAQLVDPHDVAGLAAAMRHTLLDPVLRARLAAKGLKRVTAFSWDRCARRVLEVFQAAHSARRVDAVARHGVSLGGR